MTSKDRKLRRCVMPICKDERFDLVHKFPMDNKRAEEWCCIINVPELKDFELDQLRKRFFLCSKHFRKEDYKNCESRSLNKTAYPCLFLKPDDSSGSADEASTAQTKKITTVMDIQNLTDTISSVPVLKMELNTEQPNLPTPNKVRSIDSMLSDNITIIRETVKVLSTTPQAQLKRKVPIEDTSKMQILKNEVTNSPSFVDGCANVIPQKQFEHVNLRRLQAESDNFENATSNRNFIKQYNEKNANTLASNIVFPANRAFKILSMTMEHIELECSDFSEPLNLNYFWLRDHCRCSNCYSSDTHQRKLNILDIPEAVRPKKIVFSKKDVVIIWNDDHESTYNLQFLHKMQQSEFLNEFRNSSYITKQLWNNSEIQTSNYARVSLNDYLSNDSVAKELLSSLLAYGVAFIQNVPINLPSTELAIKRLFSVQKTIFGEMYSFTDAKEHQDSAYSTEALLAHTDNTYFNDPAGLQVLHCLQAGSGGETILVDGFRAIKQLQKKNPDAFEWLSTTNVPAEYIENGHYFKHYDPIIKLDPNTGEPLQIRFNLSDRAPFNTLPQHQMSHFYKSIRALASEIQSPENEWKFKLCPGTIMVFDNWRMLHGRTAYTGRRQMVGCYVSRSEFLSVVRTMGLLN